MQESQVQVPWVKDIELVFIVLGMFWSLANVKTSITNCMNFINFVHWSKVSAAISRYPWVDEPWSEVNVYHYGAAMSVYERLKSWAEALDLLFFMQKQLASRFTLPETNIAPENGWLEYYFPIG